MNTITGIINKYAKLQGLADAVIILISCGLEKNPALSEKGVRGNKQLAVKNGNSDYIFEILMIFKIISN